MCACMCVCVRVLHIHAKNTRRRQVHQLNSRLLHAISLYLRQKTKTRAKRRDKRQKRTKQRQKSGRQETSSSSLPFAISSMILVKSSCRADSAMSFHALRSPHTVCLFVCVCECESFTFLPLRVPQCRRVQEDNNQGPQINTRYKTTDVCARHHIKHARTPAAASSNVAVG